MNHISHVLFLVLKTCQNLNSGDAQLRHVTLAARHLSHQSKKVKHRFQHFSTVFRVCIQYVSPLVGLEPSVLSINIAETSSRKTE